MSNLMKYVDPDLGDIADKKMRDLVEPDNKEVVEMPTNMDEMEEVESDFETVRDNIEAITSQAADSLQEAIALAKSSDHPRPWEVVSQLLKTAVEVNESLLGLHEKKAKIKKALAPEAPQAPTVNNPTQNNYYMSTKEVAELLKGGS